VTIAVTSHKKTLSVFGVTKRSSTPDVPQDLREPEVLTGPMELLRDEVRSEIYSERTKRVKVKRKKFENKN
jgi:hypothetical protein